MGCRGWQVLETPESQEWETRRGSSRERSHWRLTPRWERNLPLRGSCRFLEEQHKRAKFRKRNPKHKINKRQQPEGPLTDAGGPGSVGGGRSCVPGGHGRRHTAHGTRHRAEEHSSGCK